MTTIEKDTVASVHYTGTFPDSGDEFDSSRDGDPLTFLVGHGGMIPGFEREIMGASVGDTRSFTLEPEDAYGMPSDEMAGKTLHFEVEIMDVRTANPDELAHGHAHGPGGHHHHHEPEGDKGDGCGDDDCC